MLAMEKSSSLRKCFSSCELCISPTYLLHLARDTMVSVSIYNVVFLKKQYTFSYLLILSLDNLCYSETFTLSEHKTYTWNMTGDGCTYIMPKPSFDFKYWLRKYTAKYEVSFNLAPMLMLINSCCSCCCGFSRISSDLIVVGWS